MSDETQVIDILKETRRNLDAGRIVFASVGQKGFELERELGSGGMGVVWLARDLELDRRTALKFLPGLVRDPVAERDLRDEVKNALDLIHENIVGVRALRKDETSIAIEMEYVDGPSISRLIADSPNCWLDPEKAAQIVRGVCLAIDYAWKPPHKLVHRDLKPLNLLLNSSGVVKVVDFGIAHSVSETVARLTNVSDKRVVGSLPYMSPQQLQGKILHLNDVYSIGATVYELLTGTPPFRGRDVATLSSQIKNDNPPTMTERRKELIAEKKRQVSDPIVVPKNWEQVIASCLAKDPAKRPQGAREIAHRLGLVSESITVAPFTKPGEPGGRRKWVGASVAAAAVIGIGVAGWTFRDRMFPSPKPQPTQPVANLQVVPDPTPAVSAKPKSDIKQSDAPTGTTKTPESAKSADPIKAAPVEQSRATWQLLANSPTRVTFLDGATPGAKPALNAGARMTIPADQQILVEALEGKAPTFEIDGELLPAKSAPSNRWDVMIPSARSASRLIVEAKLPFEDKVTKAESEWLRGALAGSKTEEERKLVLRLFDKNSPLNINQWRARTRFDFTPTAATLDLRDPQCARAIDLALGDGRVKVRFIRIDPGTFKRGNEVVPITKPFYIGIHEVTNAQYKSVGLNLPSSDSKLDNGPVVGVTKRLLLHEGGGNGPDGAGFIPRVDEKIRKLSNGLLRADLPNSDEWEFACRATTTTIFNNNSDSKTAADLDQIAYYDKSKGGPSEVGKLKPNLWGLYDMHGNVEEWTRAPNLDDTFREQGGSWHSSGADGISSSAINTLDAATKGKNTLGFRLVLREQSK